MDEQEAKEHETAETFRADSRCEQSDFTDEADASEDDSADLSRGNQERECDSRKAREEWSEFPDEDEDKRGSGDLNGEGGASDSVTKKKGDVRNAVTDVEVDTREGRQSVSGSVARKTREVGKGSADAEQVTGVDSKGERAPNKLIDMRAGGTPQTMQSESERSATSQVGHVRNSEGQPGVVVGNDCEADLRCLKGWSVVREVVSLLISLYISALFLEKKSY